MSGRIGNNLTVIENGKISTYMLDDRLEWEIGRPSKDNQPDIKLYSTTVSRKHGKFQNMDGIWFYLDYSGKNGTVYNNKHIDKGRNGRVKPLMLSDGDIFVFGGGAEASLNYKTIWAMYSTHYYSGNWRVEDTKDWQHFVFRDDEQRLEYDGIERGQVICTEHGIAIYMGSVTYLTGNIELQAS